MSEVWRFNSWHDCQLCPEKLAELVTVLANGGTLKKPSPFWEVDWPHCPKSHFKLHATPSYRRTNQWHTFIEVLQNYDHRFRSPWEVLPYLKQIENDEGTKNLPMAEKVSKVVELLDDVYPITDFSLEYFSEKVALTLKKDDYIGIDRLFFWAQDVKRWLEKSYPLKLWEETDECVNQLMQASNRVGNLPLFRELGSNQIDFCRKVLTLRDEALAKRAKPQVQKDQEDEVLDKVLKSMKASYPHLDDQDIIKCTNGVMAYKETEKDEYMDGDLLQITMKNVDFLLKLFKPEN